MAFSSYIFIFFFLPISCFIYYGTPQRGRNLILTALSYFFYGWANSYFVCLLLASTLISFWGTQLMVRAPDRSVSDKVSLRDETDEMNLTQKSAFWGSIAANLSLLLFFKYFNVGIDNFNTLVSALGLEGLQCQGAFRVALPLGISFYTFKMLSYIIDVYLGRVRATKSLIDFACYASMFPQLIAGPIARYADLADQLDSRTHTTGKFVRGASFFCLGLAKKVLIADSCGKVADTCFNAASLQAADAWYGLFAYSLQIYFDFSAYSDMAIGLCLMFGFVIQKNFDSPYLADSFADFWRRWHISLSSWIRDYLFTPLTYTLLTDRIRNRMIREKFRYNYPALASSLIAFTACGIWHGAGWTFAIWGAIHGTMLALEQLRGKNSRYLKLPRQLRVAITFLGISLAWVFFRAKDLPAAMGYFKSLFGLGEPAVASGLVAGLIYQPYYLLTLMTAAAIAWGAPQTWDFTRSLGWRKAAWSYCMFLVAIAVLVTRAHSPFIYAAF